MKPKPTPDPVRITPQDYQTNPTRRKIADLAMLGAGLEPDTVRHIDVTDAGAYAFVIVHDTLDPRRDIPRALGPSWVQLVDQEGQGVSGRVYDTARH